MSGLNTLLGRKKHFPLNFEENLDKNKFLGSDLLELRKQLPGASIVLQRSSDEGNR